MEPSTVPLRADAPHMEVDVLIVGAGPAGASLACFLAHSGITKGLIITQDASTSKTPRAHYTACATFECLRTIGLEDECRQLSNSNADKLPFYRICSSMNGKELARAYTFGADPRKRGEYWEASPCEPRDLPQSSLEPILVRYACQSGFSVRHSTKLLTFKDNAETGLVESVLEDRLTGGIIQVTSKYLCGADGGRSTVANILQLPFTDKGTGALALNVRVEADLSHLMASSPGILHLCCRSDLPQKDFAVAAIARAIVPWTEWCFILVAKPGVTRITASQDEILAHCRDLLENDSVTVKLKDISYWRINECYAERYSKGRVFCLGDAVHRHPPHNGLGSNTCIQDAFNLAWKLAYVLQGKAGPSLLATYNAERQPVGKQVVTRANDTVRLHLGLYELLGVLEADPSKRLQAFAEFEADSPAGAARRAALRARLHALEEERAALGAEMNQAYASAAVHARDEPPGARPAARDARDAALRVLHSTHPGFRVPHAWLGVPTARGLRPPPHSTRDLVGYTHFTLLTGIGGAAPWRAAAARAVAALGVEVPLKVFGIGWGADHEDTFFTWFERREVGEKGAVLVRPDKFVAWRWRELPPEPECSEKLTVVLRGVLGWAGVRE